MKGESKKMWKKVRTYIKYPGTFLEQLKKAFIA